MSRMRFFVPSKRSGSRETQRDRIARPSPSSSRSAQRLSPQPCPVQPLAPPNLRSRRDAMRREPDFTYDQVSGSDSLQLKLWRVAGGSERSYRVELSRLKERRDSRPRWRQLTEP